MPQVDNGVAATALTPSPQPNPVRDRRLQPRSGAGRGRLLIRSDTPVPWSWSLPLYLDSPTREGSLSSESSREEGSKTPLRRNDSWPSDAAEKNASHPACVEKNIRTPLRRNDSWPSNPADKPKFGASRSERRSSGVHRDSTLATVLERDSSHNFAERQAEDTQDSGARQVAVGSKSAPGSPLASKQRHLQTERRSSTGSSFVGGQASDSHSDVSLHPRRSWAPAATSQGVADDSNAIAVNPRRSWQPPTPSPGSVDSASSHSRKSWAPTPSPSFETKHDALVNPSRIPCAGAVSSTNRLTQLEYGPILSRERKSVADTVPKPVAGAAVHDDQKDVAQTPTPVSAFGNQTVAKSKEVNPPRNASVCPRCCRQAVGGAVHALMKGLLATTVSEPNSAHGGIDALIDEGLYGNIADEVWRLISLEDPASLDPQTIADSLPTLSTFRSCVQQTAAVPLSTIGFAEAVGPRVPLAEIPWWCLQENGYSAPGFETADKVCGGKATQVKPSLSADCPRRPNLTG